MASSEAVVRFVGLTKKFGNFTAVSDVNLEIMRGEILGFVGPNGAGKSTTMKLMANLIDPTAGEVWIRANGQLERLTESNKDYLLDKFGFLIENPEFYSEVSPRQILGYFGKLRGYPRDKLPERVDQIVRMVGMTEWIDKKIGTFSKGMRQKIGIIAALVHDPDIIVLDEPHSGLDPKARKEVRDFILKLKEMGKTVFLSSHLLFEVSELADRVAIISRGRIIACDSIANLEIQAKRSAIRIELLNIPEGKSAEIGRKIADLTRPLNGLPKNDSIVKYNTDSKVYEVIFNGEPANQHKILKTLIDAGLEITEFSVPKATLLEDIYLDFIQQAESEIPPVTPSIQPLF